MENPNQQHAENVLQVLSLYVLPTEAISLPSVIKSASIIPVDIINHCLSDANIKNHFVKAFTHQSYDWENSYEAKEFSGDLLSNMFTYKKIARTLPNLSPEEATNILSHYKSNEVFSRALLAAIPNVKTIIRIRKGFEITEKIYADVFEALIQAVYDASNSFIPGIGYSCAENVFILLTNSIDIERKYVQGHSKSVAIQLLSQQGLKSEGAEMDNGTYNIELSVTKEGVSFLRTYFPDLTIPKAKFESTKANKKLASKEVYKQVVDTLSAKGVTLETLEIAKTDSIINNSKLRRQIRDKMGKKERLVFHKSKTDEGFEWKLIAENNTSKQKYLIGVEESDSGSTNFHIAKEALLVKYVKSDPRDKA